MISLREAAVVVPTPEGDTTILHPVTLDLRERRISIIGGNGSGKSTLARLCNGLVEPSAGRVLAGSGSLPGAGDSARDPSPPDHRGVAAEAGAAPGTGAGRPADGSPRDGALRSGALTGDARLDGTLPDRAHSDGTHFDGAHLDGAHGDSARLDSALLDRALLDTARDGAAVRRMVGFVFTDASAQLIMPTVEEDVALSLRRVHRKKSERLAAARAVLERFGLDRLAERSVHTLSGGQKQLLAIATVLATDPAVLIADEPTTLLDLRNARMIGDLLMSLPQQVIVVTHDLELAARADRTLVVEGGRIVFDGEPAAAVAHYRDRVAA